MRNNLFLSILMTLFTYQFLIKNTNAQSDGDVRLTGGDEYKGLVEIYYNGTWGTICGHGIATCYPGNAVFSVICKQLGYDQVVQGFVGHQNQPWGKGTGPIWLYKLICNGSEATVGDCDHDGWKDWEQAQYCHHPFDISVHCGFCPDDGCVECTDHSDCCDQDDDDNDVPATCFNGECILEHDVYVDILNTLDTLTVQSESQCDAVDTLAEQLATCNNALANELTACYNALLATSDSDSGDENANALMENNKQMNKNDNDVESYHTIHVEFTDSTLWLFCGVFVVVNVCIYLGFYLYNKK